MTTSEIRETLIGMGFKIVNESYHDNSGFGYFEIGHSLLPGHAIKVEANEHCTVYAHRWLYQTLTTLSNEIEAAIGKSRRALQRSLEQDQPILPGHWDRKGDN